MDVYAHFEFNKVIKIVMIKHKNKTTEKAVPADVHQPSMFSCYFFNCYLFFYQLSLKES